MTWQVEQAQDPPQAPCEDVRGENGERGEGKAGRTFHFEIFGLGDIH